MGRKTSKFIRKRITQGRVESGFVVFHPNAWVGTIRCVRDYNDESIIGETTNCEVADAAVASAQLVLQKMINRAVAPADTEAHDLLSHCIGVTQIRVIDMGGIGANGIMMRLNQASRALERTRARWDRTGEWGLDGMAITELRDALDLYETILRASSPQLMEIAQRRRVEQVKRAQGVAA